MALGVDLLPQEPIVITIGGKEYPLNYAGGRPLALLEAHFGGPLMQKTLPAVFTKLVEGTVADMLFIAWVGLQHLGENAPSVEEVERASVIDLISGESGWGDGPVVQALLQVLPKKTAPSLAKSPILTGTGSSPSTFTRWFSGVRKRIFGTA